MYIFGGIIKIPKSINNSVWLKMKLTQEIINIAGPLQHIVRKILTNWAKLPTYPGALDFLSSSNIYFGGT